MIVLTGDGGREMKDGTKLWVIVLRAGGSTYSRKCFIQTSFGWAGGTESSQEIPIISTKQASSLHGTLWASPVLAWTTESTGKAQHRRLTALLFVMNSFLAF